MEFGSFSFSFFFFKVFFLTLSCTRERQIFVFGSHALLVSSLQKIFLGVGGSAKGQIARSLVWLGTSHRVEAFLLACSFWEGF